MLLTDDMALKMWVSLEMIFEALECDKTERALRTLNAIQLRDSLLKGGLNVHIG